MWPLLVFLSLSVVETCRADATEKLPGGAIARLGSLQAFHGGVVRSTELSDDETLVVTVSRGFCTIWNTANPQQPEIIDGNNLPGAGMILDAAFRDSNETLLVCTSAGYFHWNREKRQCDFSHEYGTPYYGRPAFSPDGKCLATWNNKDVVVMDLTKRGASASPIKMENGITALALSPDSRLFAVADVTGRIRLWDIATGKPVATSTVAINKARDESFLRFLSIGPDGTATIAAGQQHIHKFDIGKKATYEPLSPGKDKSFSAIAVSANGRFLAVGDNSGTVRVWDLVKWQKTLLFAAHKQPISAISLSKDAKTLVSSSLNEPAKVWDATNGKLLQSFGSHEGHRGEISDIAFTPDGNGVITAGKDQQVMVWDRSGKFKKALPIDPSFIGLRGLQLARSVQMLAVPRSEGVDLWALPELTRRSSIEWKDEYFRAAAFSRDGKKLAVAAEISPYDSSDRSAKPKPIPGKRSKAVVRIYDAHDVKLRKELEPGLSQVSQLMFNPDGNGLLIYGLAAQARGVGPRTIVYRNLATGAEDWRLQPRIGFAGKLALASDGANFVAVNLWNIGLYDCKTGQLKRVAFRASASPGTIAISPRRGLIAIGIDDPVKPSRLALWDSRTGQIIHTLEGAHGGNITALVFSDDGRFLASGSSDTTAVIWDIDSLEKKAAR